MTSTLLNLINVKFQAWNSCLTWPISSIYITGHSIFPDHSFTWLLEDPSLMVLLYLAGGCFLFCFSGSVSSKTSEVEVLQGWVFAPFLFPSGNMSSWMHPVLCLQNHLFPDVYQNYFSILRSSFSSRLINPADISTSIFNWYLKFHMSNTKFLNTSSQSKLLLPLASFCQQTDILLFQFLRSSQEISFFFKEIIFDSSFFTLHIIVVGKFCISIISSTLLLVSISNCLISCLDCCILPTLTFPYSSVFSTTAGVILLKLNLGSKHLNHFPSGSQ